MDAARSAPGGSGATIARDESNRESPWSAVRSPGKERIPVRTRMITGTVEDWPPTTIPDNSRMRENFPQSLSSLCPSRHMYFPGCGTVFPVACLHVLRVLFSGIPGIPWIRQLAFPFQHHRPQHRDQPSNGHAYSTRNHVPAWNLNRRSILSPLDRRLLVGGLGYRHSLRPLPGPVCPDMKFRLSSFGPSVPVGFLTSFQRPPTDVPSTQRFLKRIPVHP